MPRSAQPRKKYRPKPINIPVMPELIRKFEMQLRTSLAVLKTSPTFGAFEAIAWIFDVVGVTMEKLNKPELITKFRIIQSGASAMIQIKGKFERTGVVHMTDLEFLPIANAVNECVEVLPKLGVNNLYSARRELRKTNYE